MSSTGRTIRLFLVDGSPTGILTAEIMNWTGQVLATPRSRLSEALARPEAQRTGIYLLTGDDPANPTKPTLYIGEGDSVIDRIKSHAKDASKEFWTHAFVVTSKDANLTKAHVRYLESRLVELAKAAGRSIIANGNEPSPKQLPEADRADMEFFLAQMQIVLPALGLDVLRPKATKAKTQADETAVSSGADVMLSLTNKKHGISASAVESDGEVTVLAGSSAVATGEFAQNSYADLRQSLIDDGSIISDANGKMLRFVEAVSFASPSAAAAVVLNRNSNGRTEWRVETTGQTLKEWQDAKLESISPATRAEPSGPPDEGATWNQLVDYCLSLDGYADGQRTTDECFEIARRVDATGVSDSNLDDLRIAAFFWQRAFAWCAPQEQTIYERKVRAAVEELRKRAHSE